MYFPLESLESVRKKHILIKILGNKYFSKWIMTIPDLFIYRTTNHNDIIPHLPPRIFIPGVYSEGKKAFYI